MEGSLSSGLQGEEGFEVHYEERVEEEMVQYEERVEEEKVEGKGVAAVTHGGWACEGEGEGEREDGEEGPGRGGEVKPCSSRR